MQGEVRWRLSFVGIRVNVTANRDGPAVVYAELSWRMISRNLNVARKCELEIDLNGREHNPIFAIEHMHHLLQHFPFQPSRPQ